jgi:hypothetical protein
MFWNLFHLLRKPQPKQRPSFQPRLEVLEDRLVPSGTSTALSASPSPALVSSAVTLTATVSPTLGVGTPTGQVLFQYGALTLGTSSLSLVGALDEALLSTTLLLLASPPPASRPWLRTTI